MNGIGLQFDQNSINRLKTQFDNLIKELNTKGQVNIDLNRVNDDISKIKSKLNDLITTKPIDLSVNTANVESDLKKTVKTVEEAIQHYEKLGKVSSPKRLYDENGNLKEFTLELSRIDGLVERISLKASAFEEIRGGKLKGVEFSVNSITEIDKTLQATEKLVKEEEKIAEAIGKAREQAELRRKEEEKLLEINQAKASNKALESNYELQQRELQRIQKLGEFKATVSPDLISKSNDEIKKYVQSLYNADAKVVGFKRTLDGAGNSVVQLTVNTKNSKNQIEQESIVLDKNTNSLYKNSEAIKNNNSKNVGFVDRLKNALVAVTSFATVTTLFYTAVRQIQGGIRDIISLDDAIVGLKKVTQETEDTYKNFIITSNEMAKSVGHSTKAAIEATTEFAKLGYSLEESKKLAEQALIYSNIGDIDIKSATESMIGTLKGFNLELSQTEHIIDATNAVGNKFAITSGSIGEALKRSSSSLFEANNTLEESIGLIAGANATIQDPEKVGNALKTVSINKLVA